MIIYGTTLFIPILLLIAALIAASEAALLSLTRTQLERIREYHPIPYDKISKLLLNPEVLLSTIIVANESISIIIGTLITSLVEQNFPYFESHEVILLSIAISSSLLLFISEILQKVTAFKLNEFLAPLLIHPILFFCNLVRPIQSLLTFVSLTIIKICGIKLHKKNKVDEQDILGLIELGEETGGLNKDETKMIQNVFAFSDKSIPSLMTPWESVLSIPTNISTQELISKLRKKMFSRIPVLEPGTNKVIGILYTKEFLKSLLAYSNTQNEPINQKLHPPYIITIHKPVAKLFREFKTKKVHLALVVDEFGNQLGVITLEDILNGILKTT